MFNTPFAKIKEQSHGEAQVYSALMIHEPYFDVLFASVDHDGNKHTERENDVKISTILKGIEAKDTLDDMAHDFAESGHSFIDDVFNPYNDKKISMKSVRNMVVYLTPLGYKIESTDKELLESLYKHNGQKGLADLGVTANN